MKNAPDTLYGEPLPPPVPLGRPPAAVRDWFDDAAAALIPDHDGTLATARSAAGAYASRAKAGNTRRAYRAGVRAWCDWCDRFGLPCLPGRAADVAAFLAAGCPVPTAEAAVGETMAGITRHAAETGDTPARKLAATAAILRQILAPIEADLAGLRDRALLLLGFAGALRRAELAAVRVEHLEPCDRGLRLTLPLSKGERSGGAVTVAIPYGSTELCPVRALRQWQLAAGITDGPLFRRIWTPPRGRTGRNTPLPRLGYAAIDAGTVARVVQGRAKAAGFDPDVLGGHSLKRGALSTGMERGIHPTRLKQLGRHKSYAVLDVYLELGDPFEAHPLNGVL